MAPLPINVPRALCMGWPLPINVKAVSQTYRQPLARPRFVSLEWLPKSMLNPPTLGVSKPLWGEVYLPPTPLHLGPLAAKVGPESSIRTLYVYWGLTLVRMDQILRRGGGEL